MSPTSIELGRGMCVLRMVSVNHEVGVPLERGTDWGSGGKEARDGRGVVDDHLTSGGLQFLLVAVTPGDTHR